MPQSVSEFMRARAGGGGAAPPTVTSFMQSRAPQPPPADEAPSLLGGAKNLVSSTGRLLGGVAEMVAHPLDTLSGVNELGWGAAEKVSPGIRGKVTGESASEINPVDQVISNLKERYGSWEGVKKTAYNDPAGMMADIASIMSGAGGAVEGAGKLAGVSKVARVGEAVGEASRFVDPLNLVAKGAASVSAPIVKGAARLGSEAAGLTTGAGGEAVRTAFKSPSIAFKEAMRGDIDITDIANNVKAAVQKLRQQRGTEYRAALAQLPQMDLDIRPVQHELIQNLDDFGVQLQQKIHPTTGAITIVPNFSLSKIGDISAQNEIRKVVKDVLDWPGRVGAPPNAIPSELVDTLKQRLDSYYNKSSDARKLTASMRSSVRSTLSVVPGYDQMTGAYERATRFLDEVEPELSAKTGTSKGTMVRKLTYALNQNNDYRQLLVEALDAKTGAQLKDQLAGFALNRWAPRGLMRTVSGFNILYGIGHGFNPMQLLELTLTSPRAMGEAISGAGELSRAAGPAAKKVVRAAGRPAVYRPVMAAARPETLNPLPPPDQEYDFVPGQGLVPRQR